MEEKVGWSIASKPIQAINPSHWKLGWLWVWLSLETSKNVKNCNQKTDLMQSGAPESCTSDEPLPIHLQLGQVAKWQRRCPDDGPGWRPHVPCRNSREVVWIKHNEAKRSDSVKRRRNIKHPQNIHKNLLSFWWFEQIWHSLCVTGSASWSPGSSVCALTESSFKWLCCAMRDPFTMQLVLGQSSSRKNVKHCIKGYGKRSKPFKT